MGIASISAYAVVVAFAWQAIEADASAVPTTWRPLPALTNIELHCGNAPARALEAIAAATACANGPTEVYFVVPAANATGHHWRFRVTTTAGHAALSKNVIAVAAYKQSELRVDQTTESFFDPVSLSFGTSLFIPRDVDAVTASVTISSSEGTPAILGVSVEYNPAQSQPRDMCVACSGYLARLLTTMQEQFIDHGAVDWLKLRQDVMLRATGAETLGDTVGTAKFAVQSLHDKHSRLLSAEDMEVIKATNNGMLAEAAGAGAAGDAAMFKLRMLNATTAYISIPSFAGVAPQDRRNFAQRLRNVVKSVSEGVSGWVIDLRSNTGGSSQPPIAALRPLLGPGTLGYYVFPDGRRTRWTYGDESVEERAHGAEVYFDSPSVLSARDRKLGTAGVAILMGPQTMSAGECVAIAFKGRPNTRFFGAPTAGFTTVVSETYLDGGSLLALSSGRYADRSGHVYEGAVAPDEALAVESIKSASDDDAVTQAALKWLAVQPASGAGAVEPNR